MFRYLMTLVFLFTGSINACELGDIQFDNDFAGASSDKMIESCSYDQANNKINFVLKPENQPINNSPWYAFKLSSLSLSNVTVEIKVNGGGNRYPPKISSDGKNWKLIDSHLTKPLLTFQIPLSEKPLWVSAQEIVTNKDYVDWSKKQAALDNVTRYEVGRSVKGEPIFALEVKKNPEAKQWLVVLGRQHPPEITGALALFPFVETLLKNNQVTWEFFQRYNVLIVPNLNPDGVLAGHWRHNHNGVDLNRDWNKFAQPEVASVHNRMQQLVNEGGKMAMAVDFHSTHKDIFYTMPNDYGVEQRYLVNNWLGGLDKQYRNFSVIQKPGNNPGKGVFKQYFADYYKVHAITYEMGDNTDRKFIDTFAKDAAISLMETMLNENSEPQL